MKNGTVTHIFLIFRLFSLCLIILNVDKLNVGIKRELFRTYSKLMLNRIFYHFVAKISYVPLIFLFNEYGLVRRFNFLKNILKNVI